MQLFPFLFIDPIFKQRSKSPKPKAWLIAIGTSACKLGMAFYKQNRYEINFHGIDSTNNSHDSITWFYKTRLSDKLLDYHNQFEDVMEEDWHHNVGGHYFEECIRLINGNVILLTNLGGKTGSFVTHKLVTELIKIKGLKVKVVCSTPFEFWSGEQGALLAQKCCDQLKREKVDMKVLDFMSYLTSHSDMEVNESFKHMDSALIEEITYHLINN